MDVIIDGVRFLPAPLPNQTNAEKSMLDVSFMCRDLRRQVTVREFITTLLKTLWVEEERFSGKRPFGNSGWKHSMEAAFVREGIIEGNLDEDGYINDSDTDAFNSILVSLIDDLGK